ncbi:hypothetical protein QBC36DRAFT_361584 [Triangularia setosa]|uniref:Tat pathway signal sequence n=1 Tax=Triangularia setosa TaxID=2587417 RepID=A0AAN7A4E3_9PEZI|nr:hypothetical protein QBC36DRAFT_361584 [Podospora setosa]
MTTGRLGGEVGIDNGRLNQLTCIPAAVIYQDEQATSTKMETSEHTHCKAFRISEWEHQEDTSLHVDQTESQHASLVKSSNRSQIMAILFPWLFNAVFLALLASRLFYNLDTELCHYTFNAGVPSPVEDVVEYVPVQFHRAFGRDLPPYQGWPDDEKNDLWEALYSYGASIHVDENLASQLHDKAERAPVHGLENKYIVEIDVFHQLHCMLHIDHCIESLRQSITCHSDINAFTYWWLDSKKIMEPELGTMHVYRNFSKIRDWAFDRFVNLADRRKHVENSRIVDYSGWGLNPENAPVVEKAPSCWKSNAADLATSESPGMATSGGTMSQVIGNFWIVKPGTNSLAQVNPSAVARKISKCNWYLLTVLSAVENFAGTTAASSSEITPLIAPTTGSDGPLNDASSPLSID